MTRNQDNKHSQDDAFLETHFEAARRHVPAPGDDVIQRILEDANAQQAAPCGPRVEPVQKAPHGIKALLDALGGWPAAASLSCAAAVGLWIGVAPPDVLTFVAQDYFSTQTDGAPAADADGGFDFLEEML
ncbi:hypothetical protein [Roseovarius phycicola]|uniref:Dihydroorotate dehydrogenase n=1 Tax=Roseovarius phycicola TaxID=3080976 RepID=A0ABZ2HR76_9RHOB